jgi:hypothetical protein
MTCLVLVAACCMPIKKSPRSLKENENRAPPSDVSKEDDERKIYREG